MIVKNQVSGFVCVDNNINSCSKIHYTFKSFYNAITAGAKQRWGQLELIEYLYIYIYIYQSLRINMK